MTGLNWRGLSDCRCLPLSKLSEGPMINAVVGVKISGPMLWKLKGPLRGLADRIPVSYGGSGVGSGSTNPSNTVKVAIQVRTPIMQKTTSEGLTRAGDKGPWPRFSQYRLRFP